MIGKNPTNLTKQVLQTHIMPKKIIMQLEKNIKVGIVSFFWIILIFLIIITSVRSNEETNFLVGNFVEIKILNKVSSKNELLKIKIGENIKYKNISIIALKCKNSEFDDNPEITAYMQVQDVTLENNDKVFVFNGWTFSSSPSISLFDHPVYDIWLINCY